MKPRIKAAISNVNMNASHKGLSEIAKGLGFPAEKLAQGELLLFLNRKRDKLKCLGAQGVVLAYVRMPDGSRLPLEAVQYIPRTFSLDGKIDLNRAISSYLVDKLKRSGKSVDAIEWQRN